MTRESARALKSFRLLLALESYGRRQHIDPETVRGTNQLVELATRFTARDWELLSKAAGLSTSPSADTRDMVFLFLDAKARHLFDLPPVRVGLALVPEVANG
ncbi:MAG TPA: hypothetical protein VGK73_11675 [Polyangiaceae bacterium]